MESQTSSILDSYKKNNSESSFTFLPKNKNHFLKMGFKRHNDAFFTKQYSGSNFFSYRY